MARIDARADDADDTPQATPIELPVGARMGLPAHRHKREWIFGTFAAVAVVALLALVLQGALAGRGSTGPTNKSTGQWQILDKLTWKRTSSGQVLPSIAPTNPQVVYEATNLVNGAAETSKVVSYASLRRTEDGGESWRTLRCPCRLPMSRPLTSLSARFALRLFSCPSGIGQVPPASQRMASVGEGCERGYVSYDGGDTWRAQRCQCAVCWIPAALSSRRSTGSTPPMSVTMTSCVHLLTSFDGGVTWHALDGRYPPASSMSAPSRDAERSDSVRGNASQLRCIQLRRVTIAALAQ